jgi:hypothetical protein
MIKRVLAKWAQRRCEQREFRGWLQVTAKPLRQNLFAVPMARKCLLPEFGCETAILIMDAR